MDVLFAFEMPENLDLDEQRAVAWDGFLTTISATMAEKTKAKIPIQKLASTVFLFPLDSGAETLSYLIQECKHSHFRYKVGLLSEPVEWTKQS